MRIKNYRSMDTEWKDSKFEESLEIMYVYDKGYSEYKNKSYSSITKKSAQLKNEWKM